MAATPESKAKKVVKDLLTDFDCYFITPATGGYGRSGAPDFMGCIGGRMFGCEVKADSDLTELQKDNLRRIEASGGYGFVVRITGRDAYGLSQFIHFLQDASNGHSSATRTLNLHSHSNLDKDDFRTEAGKGLERNADDDCDLPAVVGRRA